ncbi:MAG: 2-C-methyl-D-erythritol 4-phosphate cytidylyltransferase [Fibrobacterales bacterium]
MVTEKKIGVVLPAGGVGKRFGADKPKQLLTIHGVEIYRHCISTFLSHSSITQIAFVCPKDYVVQFTDEFKKDDSITVVAGGEHRWQSVQYGVMALSQDIEYVLAHDVARPFIQKETIDAVVEKVISSGSCIVVKPVTDTVKVVHNNHISDTIDRSTVYLAQTPQAFRVVELKEAYEEVASLANFAPTDEASIMEYLGKPVSVVLGNEWNNKITTPQDLIRFEQMLEASNGKNI